MDEFAKSRTYLAGYFKFRYFEQKTKKKLNNMC